MGAISKSTSLITEEADSDSKSSDDESESGKSEEGDEGPQIDGLSSVISKIVNQKVTKDIPVLEKRKNTNAQKDEEDLNYDVLKKKKKKIAESEPEDEATLQARALTSLTKERNLKKIASKGVVALFNAIMEAKKKSQEDAESSGGDDTFKGNPSDKRDINETVKKLTKTKFLNLLTNDKLTKRPGKEEESEKNNASKGWEVLKEDVDFHANQLMLRDWDKDDEEDD